jgi:hypothetical protein
MIKKRENFNPAVSSYSEKGRESLSNLLLINATLCPPLSIPLIAVFEDVK